MKKIQITILSFTLLMLSNCKENIDEFPQPKNVILLISDGAGLSQISSVFYFKDTSVNYSRFRNIGLINTSSSREDVTDSGAAATAFATGVKTFNGAIGVEDDSTSVENLVEIASLKHIKTGVIATSSITHATPASFFAHSISRGATEKIALQLPKSDIDFFAGGGLQFFNKRSDQLNLLNELEKNNFSIDTVALGDLDDIKSNQKQGYFLAQDAMPTIINNRGDFLSNATDLGIQFLNKDESGFFLMTEGSQVDWGGHDNDGEYLVSELIDFDDAVGKALDFAEKDGNTLVIVTSDHETGGFTLKSKTRLKDDGSEYSDYSEIDMAFSIKGHSATLVPVFAYGPGSEVFVGIYENTEIFHKIIEVTKWGNPVD
jgi:alkaline phosphatase